MQALLTFIGLLVLPTLSLDHLLTIFALSYYNQDQRDAAKALGVALVSPAKVLEAALAFLMEVPGVVLVFLLFPLFQFLTVPVSLAFLPF